MFRSLPMKLHDCRQHGAGSGAELYLVEGDSASLSVARSRDSSFQAVLPMQGKPLNAMKASEQALRKNEWFAALIDAIGTDIGNYCHRAQLRYDRIILLFDPDADGIHCGALMMMFFYRWMQPLLKSDHIAIVHAPMFEISAKGYREKLLAYGEEHYRRIVQSLERNGIDQVKSQRFRGLASLNEELLVRTCLHPQTRKLNRVDLRDAKAAVDIFSGSGQPQPSKQADG